MNIDEYRNRNDEEIDNIGYLESFKKEPGPDNDPLAMG